MKVTSSSPDLSLPEAVPEIAQDDKQPRGLLPFALYTLYIQTDAKHLEALRLKCTETEDVMEKQVQYPPNFHFRDLQSIAEYHIHLAAEKALGHKLFVVLMHPNPAVVLVVTLGYEEEKCKPDFFWTNIEDAGSILVNLQIFNISWDEAKDGYDVPAPVKTGGLNGSLTRATLSVPGGR